MGKKVKMKFSENKFVTGVKGKELFAEKGKEVEVEEASVVRWLRRGGVVVDEKESKKFHEEKDKNVGIIVDSKESANDPIKPGKPGPSLD